MEQTRFISTIKPCEHCNKKVHDSFLHHLDEGEKVCTECVDPVRFYKRKGIVTFKEIEHYHSLVTKYKELSVAINLKLKKYARKNNKDNYKLLAMLKDKLETDSITDFKKVFNILEPEEKIILATKILTTYSYELPPMKDKELDAIILNEKSNGTFWKKFYNIMS